MERGQYPTEAAPTSISVARSIYAIPHTAPVARIPERFEASTVELGNHGFSQHVRALRSRGPASIWDHR
jgi:hypothetical protein